MAPISIRCDLRFERVAWIMPVAPARFPVQMEIFPRSDPGWQAGDPSDMAGLQSDMPPAPNLWRKTRSGRPVFAWMDVASQAGGPV